MKKSTCLKEIQKRLPDDIVIQDETTFEFTDDEYVSILSWIKYFKEHYREYGKGKIPTVPFPMISKRLRLDFGLYIRPSDSETNRGKNVIYLSPNGGPSRPKTTIKELIISFHL